MPWLLEPEPTREGAEYPVWDTLVLLSVIILTLGSPTADNLYFRLPVHRDFRSLWGLGTDKVWPKACLVHLLWGPKEPTVLSEKFTFPEESR